jgi:predicted kinase
MYKKTLYIPVGITGQGKTTYGNKITLKDDSVKMISPETVKNLISSDATTEDIFEVMRQEAVKELQRGFSVFFDASNLKQKYREEVIKSVGLNAEYIVGVYFPATRDVEVSEDDVDAMMNSLEKISFEEGFNSIWTVY